mmetsp:Transcript_43643/g.78347  ORF Transcript_43643/g.78347 Transcript_43643/m.78347 type:complete len:102 (+) Transcript_43643:423-728(+)
MRCKLELMASKLSLTESCGGGTGPGADTGDAAIGDAAGTGDPVAAGAVVPGTEGRGDGCGASSGTGAAGPLAELPIIEASAWMVEAESSVGCGFVVRWVAC